LAECDNSAELMTVVTTQEGICVSEFCMTELIIFDTSSEIPLVAGILAISVNLFV
jgi:hypothetical protein